MNAIYKRYFDEKTILDVVAISLSGLCIAHCILLPVLLLSGQFAFLTGLADEHFHLFLVAGVIPVSLIAAWQGCKKHKDANILLCILSSLVLLILTAVFGHDVLGEQGEKWLTTFAATLLSIGHFKNYKQCKYRDCN